MKRIQWLARLEYGIDRVLLGPPHGPVPPIEGAVRSGVSAFLALLVLVDLVTGGFGFTVAEIALLAVLLFAVSFRTVDSELRGEYEDDAVDQEGAA